MRYIAKMLDADAPVVLAWSGARRESLVRLGRCKRMRSPMADAGPCLAKNWRSFPVRRAICAPDLRGAQIRCFKLAARHAAPRLRARRVARFASGRREAIASLHRSVLGLVPALRIFPAQAYPTFERQSALRNLAPHGAVFADRCGPLHRALNTTTCGALTLTVNRARPKGDI